jgi:hypothetical protein
MNTVCRTRTSSVTSVLGKAPSLTLKSVVSPAATACMLSSQQANGNYFCEIDQEGLSSRLGESSKLKKAHPYFP